MSDGPPKPPLSRLQAYLVETKKCVSLLREVLVEIKDLLAILTVIIFFIFGVYEALSRLVFQPAPVEGQTLSRPLDQGQSKMGFKIEFSNYRIGWIGIRFLKICY